jgi:acetyltransferase-like isoleucine patch superfamily enzyme
MMGKLGKFTYGLHKRSGQLKNKLFMLLWYRFIFYKTGSRCSISRPIFTHKPEYIQLGNRVSIGPYCRIEAHPAQPGSRLLTPVVTIGHRVRIEHGVNISGQCALSIEDDVLIAGGCYISDNNHSIDPEGPRYLDQPLTSAPTVIGKGAWLGQNVCILAGSFIGERSIIGAGSVVNGHIPSYSIAVGAPARVVKKYNFESKQWVRVSYGESHTKLIKGV